MMTSAWNLDGARVTQKGWSNAKADKPAAGGNKANQAGTGVSQAVGGAVKNKEHHHDVPSMNYSEAQLVETFRTKLAARGNRGIMGLGRQFKIADDNNSGSLDIEEFKKCVHDFRIGLTPKDSERLFKIFDRSLNGSIDYEEFLRGVRGEMNEFRKGFAMRAFKIMDFDNCGTITIDDVR